MVSNTSSEMTFCMPLVNFTTPQGSKRKADTAASESEGAKYDEPDTETEDEADKHRSGGWWLLGDGGWLVGVSPSSQMVDE